jgi:hypothetical protein
MCHGSLGRSFSPIITSNDINNEKRKGFYLLLSCIILRVSTESRVEY